MSTDTNLTSLVINKLTKAQYAAAIKNPNELYITTDVPGVYLGSIPASISADGNYQLMTVGLAENLVSPGGNEANDQSFIYRSTGGDADLSDGAASLLRLRSTTTPCTTVKEEVIATPSGGITNVSVNESTFKTKVSNVAGTYTFTYNGSSWVLNSSTVTLSQYGITINSGTVSASSKIVVVYVQESMGTVTVANPVSLYSVGMNQFDKNGTQILDGYGIAVSGDIVASSGHKVIYFRALGGNQYTIYDSVNNAVSRFGFLATPPTTSSVLTSVTASSDANVNHFTPAVNGYICVDVTEINHLCCHLTWSGYNDEVYKDYFYDELIIPYEAADGTIISDYGIVTLDGIYYDEIDMANKIFYKRTARMAYSSANLSTVKAMGVPYIYDSSYIYYGIPTVTYSLNSTLNNNYRVSDFGTEEFTGTTVAITCDLLYQENLRDKIRRLDVEDLQLISNKVIDWSINPSDDKYPTEKLVKTSLDKKADINGNYPELTVGLANNLVSPDGLEQTGLSFIYRSSGGSADISDGYAILETMRGVQTTTTSISEELSASVSGNLTSASVNATTWKSQISQSGSYVFVYYADFNVAKSSNITVNLNKDTFISAVSNTPGIYEFIYNPVISSSTSGSVTAVTIDKSTFATAVSGVFGNYSFVYGDLINTSSSISGQSSTITLSNESTFLSKIENTPGTYIFVYDSGWKLNDTAVTLSQYGITTSGSFTNGDSFTVQYIGSGWGLNSSQIVDLANYGITITGTETDGATITCNYSSNAWQYNGSTVTLGNYGIAITVAGTVAINNYITLTYGGVNWKLDDNNVSLSTYGITTTGTVKCDDQITVNYTKAQTGVITNSTPTTFYSIGMNQFNKNGSKILSGYTVNSSGNVVTQSGQYVIWFKVLGDNKYTIYNSTNNSTKRIAFSTTEPTSESTGLTVSSATIAQNINYYTPAANGYIIVATTDISKLCCHLTWSGYNDNVYEDYFDYTVNIPYTAADGTVISEWGMPYLNSTYYDQIDFINKKYYKRVQREPYDATAYAGITTTKMHDNDWMYYGISTETYDLNSSVSGEYCVSDFGTEEFLGTTMNVYCDIMYQDNLRDRLRRLAEDPRSTEEKLTTAKWVNDHENTMVTNCITAIPQDISLVLDSSTHVLTIKAGTKMYIPNGFESNGTTRKFTELVKSVDAQYTYTDGNSTRFLMWQTPGNYAVSGLEGTLYSGTTAPTGSGTIYWYDTTNNIIKRSDNGGSTWLDGQYSFPLGIIKVVNSNISSIDQVFNGFGYIGSTVFALPGVRGLVPNGRRDDGSLNNLDTVLNNVVINTITGNANGSLSVFLNNWGRTNNTYYSIDARTTFRYAKNLTEATAINKDGLYYLEDENMTLSWAGGSGNQYISGYTNAVRIKLTNYKITSLNILKTCSLIDNSIGVKHASFAQVGDNTTPVYVDADGNVVACTQTPRLVPIAWNI